MRLEQIQQAIPTPIHWTVIVGGPVVAWLEVVNPILQALAFLVAISWGGFQMWIAFKRKSWKKEK